ncbi:MAG: isoaspartyl peptidase/L-asparaginase family protein [Longimicrobiaceae bacterium]
MTAALLARRMTVGACALATLAGLPAGAATQQPASTPSSSPAAFTLAIHGGAGTITRESMSPEREREYRAKLTEALERGRDVLARGGSAVDAVVAAIVVMEDSPLFNAGRGAVFTHEGANELDASIMNGATLGAGAVAGVTRVKNPIELARLVMEESRHVMFAREGAERFAVERGVELVDPEYFYTEGRWQSLQRVLERERAGETSGQLRGAGQGSKLGTVGAVALDRAGNLAAGTSTGGMTNKRFGRVGDSPIIGAGTYANNRSCAVSATGHGEFFIRLTIARDVCARVEWLGVSIEEAANSEIHSELDGLGATGGVIVLDPEGKVAAVFNTEGMYRGWVKGDGDPVVEIYRD